MFRITTIIIRYEIDAYKAGKIFKEELIKKGFEYADISIPIKVILKKRKKRKC